jgi:hypothetical protein
MFGNFWTKPTQGKQFTCVRDQIMGVVDQEQMSAGTANNKHRKRKSNRQKQFGHDSLKKS